MSQRSSVSQFSIFVVSMFLIFVSSSFNVRALEEQTQDPSSSGSLVKKKVERRLISSSEYGEVSAVTLNKTTTDLSSYQVQFITLEPSSIFLPVVLYSDMVFYVHSGSGSFRYIIDEGRMQTKKLRQGDVFGLNPGTVFYIEAIQCMEKLNIHAIFGNLKENFREPEATGPYSSFRDLLLDFDKKILQETFKVPAEVMQEIFNAPSPPAIVSAPSKTWELEASFIKVFRRTKGTVGESDLLNMFSVERDFENNNGWITTLNKKKLPGYLKGLMGLKFGSFMTNLSSGSMVAPHWNPAATEIAIVLQGKGMVRVVCSSANEISYEGTRCRDTRFKVEEGDVFVVPRLHPTAQMAFGDDTFVFVGFSTATPKMKKTSSHHQYLVGKISIFRGLGRSVLAATLGVNGTMIDVILGSQLGESAVLGCNLCAEEELRIMEEEEAMEKAQQEQTGTGEGEESKSPVIESGKETETSDESGKMKIKNY